MATEDWRNSPPYVMQPHFSAKYTAQCYCGAVAYEVSIFSLLSPFYLPSISLLSPIQIAEDPVDSTYCHCRGCQVLHGAPLQWASIFRKEAIQFTKGVANLLFYNSGTMNTTHELPCKVQHIERGCEENIYT